MQPFEVRAAFIMGAALPILETARRGFDLSTIAFYVDDFIAGALLIFAAFSVFRRRAYGRPLLVAAWGILCGGLYGSFFGQIESSAAADVSGAAHGLVIFIKGLLLAVAIVALVLSVQALCRRVEG